MGRNTSVYTSASRMHSPSPAAKFSLMPSRLYSLKAHSASSETGLSTHNAVASAVLRAYQKETGDARRSVIVSTASPYKFGASVLGAVAGQAACAGLDDFACCRALAELTGTREPAQILALPDLPIRHTAVCEKDAMEQAVLEQIRA